MESIQGFVHIFRFLLFFCTSIAVAAATKKISARSYNSRRHFYEVHKLCKLN